MGRAQLLKQLWGEVAAHLGSAPGPAEWQIHHKSLWNCEGIPGCGVRRGEVPACPHNAGSGQGTVAAFRQGEKAVNTPPRALQGWDCPFRHQTKYRGLRVRESSSVCSGPLGEPKRISLLQSLGTTSLLLFCVISHYCHITEGSS